MTDRMLNNRVAKLQGIEAQTKELEERGEAIHAEIRDGSESKGEDERDNGSVRHAADLHGAAPFRRPFAAVIRGVPDAAPPFPAPRAPAGR